MSAKLKDTLEEAREERERETKLRQAMEKYAATADALIRESSV